MRLCLTSSAATAVLLQLRTTRPPLQPAIIALPQPPLHLVVAVLRNYSSSRQLTDMTMMLLLLSNVFVTAAVAIARWYQCEFFRFELPSSSSLRISPKSLVAIHLLGKRSSMTEREIALFLTVYSVSHFCIDHHIFSLPRDCLV